ncbi:MAG TPA: hypothetical protein VMU48_19615 [Terracidiphilus sp.]|nr:hypothetical protein [Terracidiphilus sp.]
MSPSFSKSQIAEEPQQEMHGADSPLETPSLVFSADDFAALEERILRAIELVKRERQARITAEDRASQAEARASEHDSVVDQLTQEVRSLRTERDHVRQRVERLLAQLDALEL